MILSVKEKQALKRRQQELEEYENEMVRRYAAQQQDRLDHLQASKAKAEKARDELLQKLAGEEEARRAEQEFLEHLRNELYVQEKEEAALEQERIEMEKKAAVRQELQ